MAFKIKDSLMVGTVTVLSNLGIIQDAALPTKVTANSYNNVTVDVYGRVTAGSTVAYLTAEVDTLATVTGRGATTGTALSISNNTAGGTGTGALVLSAGGMSVAGAIYAANVNLSSATAGGTGTGALVLTNGGMYVAGAIYAGSIQNTPIGSTTANTGAFTTLTASNTVTLSPANANVVLSPTGTGLVTINPATAGTINNVSIGATTRGSGAFTTLDANSTVTLSPSSQNVTISPSGTGTVTISPVGALTINPTAASTINNTSIGATTRGSGAFTTLASNNAVTFTAGTSSTTTGTGTLVVTGGVGISENLNVGGNFILTGNLTVNGTTTTINSTTQTLEDPIFNIGGGIGGAAPVADDAKDRGIAFQWYNASAKTGFFGFDRSTGYFTFIPDGTITGEVASGAIGDMQATNFRGALVGNADTATKLATSRSITASGDAGWTVNFDGSGNVTAAITLATVNSNVGTWNNVTVNGKGLVTAGSNTAYLTAEVDTLATVTGRGNTTTSNVQLNNAALALAPATVAKIWHQALAPATINVNTLVTLDTFAVATYRSAKYVIQIVQGTKFQISELKLIHDGTTVYQTEYSVVETSGGAPIPCTYSAAIATGTLTLSATITDAGTTNANLTMERVLFSV
jgi:hypothetical protein